MSKGILRLLFLFATGAAAQGQTVFSLPPGNLLVNGNFESGFSGWFGTYGYWDTTASGPLNPPPLSGTKVGIVDASQDPMSQIIPTTPGVTYQLRFGARLVDVDANGIT